MQQDLCHEFQHRFKYRLACQRVLNKIGEETHQLHFALLAHERAHARTVQLIESRGNAGNIGISLAAAQQNAGDECISGGLLPAHGPQKIDAEAARFKLIRLHRRQTYAGQKFKTLFHDFFLVCIGRTRPVF